MKGKSGKKLPAKFFSGANSGTAAAMASKADGFKKGGKAVAMEGKKAPCHAGRKPRKSGGSVMSSAAGAGTPRGKASHY